MNVRVSCVADQVFSWKKQIPVYFHICLPYATPMIKFNNTQPSANVCLCFKINSTARAAPPPLPPFADKQQKIMCRKY